MKEKYVIVCERSIPEYSYSYATRAAKSIASREGFKIDLVKLNRFIAEYYPASSTKMYNTSPSELPFVITNSTNNPQEVKVDSLTMQQPDTNKPNYVDICGIPIPEFKYNYIVANAKDIAKIKGWEIDIIKLNRFIAENYPNARNKMLQTHDPSKLPFFIYNNNPLQQTVKVVNAEQPLQDNVLYIGRSCIVRT